MRKDSIKNLALSVVSLTCMVVCGDYDHRSSGSVAAAVRWASITILLATFYYYVVWGVYKCWCLGEDCDRFSGYNGVMERNLDIDIDIDNIPESIDEEPEPRRRQSSTFSPELTVYSVWVYVYGWGMLLFVCVYSLAGVSVSSSCWWMIGMLVLCFEEMLSDNTERVWICCTLMFLIASVTSLLTAVSDSDGLILGNFAIGIIYPTVAPLIFFTIRGYRNSGKDLSRLFELATPFMVVVSICILFGMQNPIVSRRAAGNSTELRETHATFRHEENYMHSVSILLSPFAALACVKTLVNSVVGGHVTEFIAAFTMILATRVAAMREFEQLSLIAFVLSAVCFFVVVVVKQA